MRRAHRVLQCGFAACMAAVAASGCGSDSTTCRSAGSSEAGPQADADEGGAGMVVVNATTSSVVCPSINPIGVGPDNGGSVMVSATFSTTAQDGAVPTIAWTASSGSFSDPTALQTTFFCSGPGVAVLTLTATLPGCSQHEMATLYCD